MNFTVMLKNRWKYNFCCKVIMTCVITVVAWKCTVIKITWRRKGKKNLKIMKSNQSHIFWGELFYLYSDNLLTLNSTSNSLLSLFILLLRWLLPQIVWTSLTQRCYVLAVWTGRLSSHIPTRRRGHASCRSTLVKWSSAQTSTLRSFHALQMTSTEPSAKLCVWKL